jgi:RND family efflux transporter MFP subunit
MTQPASNGPPDAVEVTRRRRATWWIVAAISLSALVLASLTGLGAIKRETGRGSGAGKATTVPVRVAQARQRSMTLTAEYRGELVADAAELAAEVTGRLLEVRVNIGDRFKKGQLLARVDSSQTQRQVAEAQAQTRAAEAERQRVAAELDAARVELNRGLEMFEQQLISTQELDAYKSKVAVLEAQLEASEAQRAQARARIATLGEILADASLHAPFDGAVAERHLDPGSLVQPGKTILRLVQTGPLRIRFRVPERDLGELKPTLPFQLTTQATGTRHFAGKIQRISAEVAREDRSVAVEGVLDEETELLRPGMYAVVWLTLNELAHAVVVPSRALLERPGAQGKIQRGLFVVEAGTAHFRPVTVRGTAGNLSAVAPLQPGKNVVTLGHENLRDGAAVQIVRDDAP